MAGADLGVFATEIDKSGFKGSVRNNKIFKDWNRDNTFANVMDKAQDIGLKAIAKLRADGKEPENDRISKIKSALKAHADARRFNQAGKISEAFENYMRPKGSVLFTLISSSGPPYQATGRLIPTRLSEKSRIRQDSIKLNK